VNEAGSGFITKPDAHAIADALVSAIKNRKDWPEMGQRGRAFAMQHMTWDHIAQQGLQQFMSLLAENGNTTVRERLQHASFTVPRPRQFRFGGGDNG
jgi:hypothetical protein